MVFCGREFMNKTSDGFLIFVHCQSVVGFFDSNKAKNRMEIMGLQTWTHSECCECIFIFLWAGFCCCCHCGRVGSILVSVLGF